MITSAPSGNGVAGATSSTAIGTSKVRHCQHVGSIVEHWFMNRRMVTVSTALVVTASGALPIRAVAWALASAAGTYSSTLQPYGSVAASSATADDQ